MDTSDDFVESDEEEGENVLSTVGEVEKKLWQITRRSATFIAKRKGDIVKRVVVKKFTNGGGIVFFCDENGSPVETLNDLEVCNTLFFCCGDIDTFDADAGTTLLDKTLSVEVEYCPHEFTLYKKDFSLNTQGLDLCYYVAWRLFDQRSFNEYDEERPQETVARAIVWLVIELVVQF